MSRFELRRQMPGRVAKAWDAVFQRTVAVKRLPEGLTGSGSGARLLAAWERWYGAPHPGLLKPALLDFPENQLVREWVSGFTLLELLRQRRRLPGGEALALLASAAAALDHAAARGLPGIVLDKWFVAFPEESGEDPAAALLPQPMERWPAWQVRLDPLRLADLVSVGQDRTVHYVGVELPGVNPAVGVALACLRELLGGSRSRRDAPLSGLSDEQNRVLAAARRPGSFTTAAELSRALGGSFVAPPAAGSRPASRTHEYELLGPAESAARGERLLLEPTGPGARPLQLVQREELRLGRSSTEADLALRFADRSPAGQELLNSLSRIHARLRREGAGLRLLDGSATAPSSNGTFTREGPLRDPAGLRLQTLLLLQLGSHWRATLVPMPAPAERTRWRQEQTLARAEDRPGEEAWGAVFIVPSPGSTVRLETVWLLEEAGFGVAPDGSLAWDTEGLGTAPAAFHAGEGAFFLLNRRLEGTVLAVDLRPLAPGSACPLRDGMHLTAGQDAWRIRIA